MDREHIRKHTFTFLGNAYIYQSQVGYDLVDVQVDLQYVEPSVANRIEWMHGNLCVTPELLLVSRRRTDASASLTERLPFDDNEFDFVHIFGIGLSVPEDKVQFCILHKSI